jgi:hypothetical protein
VVRLEAEFAPQEETVDDIDTLSRDDFLYTAPATPAPGAEAEPLATFSEDEPAASRYEDENEDFEEEEEERSSRMLALVGALFAALIVIGAGAYLYSERATVFGFLRPSAEHPNVAAVDTATSPQPAPDVPEKKPDRLVNGSEAPPPEAPPPDAGANTAVVEPPPPAPAPPPVAALEPPSAEAAAVTPPATAAPLETGLGEDAASQEPATSLVEQRAIYYYQGSEGQAGQASQGTATWTEITKDDRPAIQATIHVPQRNVTVTVTIYKNYDATLPASHLVEVQFNGKLSESPIQRVPALVLKQTEQARGQPLAGAAVPVTNELFWIALSDDEEEVVRNVQLLREGSWFDIPILFGDQTRALITFEKGIPGDKVFETVMAGWTPS